MVTLLRNDTGRRDFLLHRNLRTPPSAWHRERTSEPLFLVGAFALFGITLDHTTLNVFMGALVDALGQVTIGPPPQRPGNGWRCPPR